MRPFRAVAAAASGSFRGGRNRISPLGPASFRRLASLASSSFGVAFDIDGVILLAHSPVGGSPRALRRLHDDSGRLKIPYVFLTNGGGYPESKRAMELRRVLGVNILPSQVIQGHSPFKDLVDRFENDLVVSVGKGDPATVMSEYGFKNVISIDEYASYFDNIDPLEPFKKWTTEPSSDHDSRRKVDVCSQRVKAVFVMSDPVDWSRDVQVLCDILRTGGLPGKEIGEQPPLYFASDDLEYQAKFPAERLGMGAFRIALEAIFNRIHPSPLMYTSYGKPNPFVFNNAEVILKHLVASFTSGSPQNRIPGIVRNHKFKTIYMVGDNPKVDIRGAREAGAPWFSILTRTGVFKERGNCAEFPADMVVDTVEDAVDFILKRECIS
ncbi:hypothetical protein MLD38_017311 [Melastoma candidum]|uniref:Uncharacterized protein n=1 Tax=Melastoma candidum TaxID=119954 RepID=A0ACB9QYF8_9MYRT|nr:hypothetical protein MLD38_017311 [Melastoma candidum]